ncbi:MAG: hypothetical protein V1874_13625 [Spirochaetota bacterium]
MTNIFNVNPDEEDNHEIGNTNCSKCWNGYPIKCDCGGLIHASFGDENSEYDYWLYYKCDKCRSTDNPHHC